MFLLSRWAQWCKRRKRELPLSVTLADAGNIALHEARCRAQIALVTGKPAAVALPMMVCRGAYLCEPTFILTDPMDWHLWQKLKHIDGLLRPLIQPDV
ncbi:hypothetical protein ACFOKI_15145 [Sphingomonas qilianensis]|uniref:Uncharacterized protein n=1 Tax=Sphingomonas qilianensis TaxID=1736690 RepID=A0ABU9XPE8_9SPHN